MISLRDGGYPEHEQTQIVHSGPPQFSWISVDPFSKKFHLSWCPVALGGGKLVLELWKNQMVLPTSSSSQIFARLLLFPQGSYSFAICPSRGGRAGYKPAQNIWHQSEVVFNVWHRKKQRHITSTFPPWDGGNPISICLPSPRNNHPGNDRLQNVHSAHFAKYLDLHISIMVFLLSGKDSDSPDQSMHKGGENFLLAL